MNNEIKKITSIWKKMFKKINIITTALVLVIVPALIIYTTILALAGIVAVAWFIIIFCKAVKKTGIAKKNNVQE